MTNYNCEAGPTSREDIDRREGITNIVAKVHWLLPKNGARLSISWEKGGDRYHIWVDEKGEIENSMTNDKPTLYKNPRLDIKYGREGYFSTRLLNPFNKANKADVDLALKSVDLKEAIVAYHANQEAGRMRRKKEEAERKARKQLETTAPRLLEALKDARHRMRNILTEEQLDAAFADGKTIRNQVQMYDDAITEAERKVDE